MPRQTRPANAPEDTRMQRDRMQAEKEAEQQARAGELTMITAGQNADDAEGLWDPTTGDLMQSGFSEAEKENLLRSEQMLNGDSDGIISEEDAQVGTLGEQMVRTDGPAVGPNGVPIGGPGYEDDEDDSITPAYDTNAGNPRAEDVARQREVPDLVKVGAGQTARRVQVLDRSAEKRVIRVNADLDPTIGRAQYHFLKGKRYEVPIHVAMHLHEKGYVSSFG